MKKEKEQRNGRFAQRALNDFYRAMLEQLTRTAFEKLTVNQICSACNYPRSTFYNYFDDLYDLMNYCWLRISEEAEVTAYADLPQSQQTEYLFGTLYAYMDSKRETIQKLLAHNAPDGAMLRSMNRFMQKTIYRFFLSCPEARKYPVPCEIMAEHYSNTVQMLLRRSFWEQKPLDRAQALSCLDFLLGTLEEPVCRPD